MERARDGAGKTEAMRAERREGGREAVRRRLVGSLAFVSVFEVGSIRYPVRALGFFATRRYPEQRLQRKISLVFTWGTWEDHVIAELVLVDFEYLLSQHTRGSSYSQKPSILVLPSF